MIEGGENLNFEILKIFIEFGLNNFTAIILIEP